MPVVEKSRNPSRAQYRHSWLWVPAQGRDDVENTHRFSFSRHISALSRREPRPSFTSSHRPLKTEGAGNAGCPMHPQPRVRLVVLVCTRVFTAEAPETSGIPHAMVLRLIARSPRGPGSLAPVIPEKLASQELNASVGAPGPHAFAVRIQRVRLTRHLRPPHPAPNVRDDRDTPLVSAKSARMCERAVLAKPPVAGTEPVTPQRRQSL
jgi:hypothetical protein